MDAQQLGRAGLSMLGLDLAYTIGSFSLSAPQTTERRMRDQEGTSETPQQAMHWVWISTAKMLAYTGLPSLLGRTIWPLLGGIVGVIDLHVSYRYAIHRGQHQSATPGGKLIERAMGSSLPTPEPPAGPRYQSQVRVDGIEPENGNRPSQGRSSVASGY